jgi:hypothetical protein
MQKKLLLDNYQGIIAACLRDFLDVVLIKRALQENRSVSDNAWRIKILKNIFIRW